MADSSAFSLSMVNSMETSAAARIVTLEYDELLDEHVDKRAKIEEARVPQAAKEDNVDVSYENCFKACE